MNAIISQTKRTITEKKKSMEQNSQVINHSIMDLNDKVRQNLELGREIEMLESDVYTLEKGLSPAPKFPHGLDAATVQSAGQDTISKRSYE